jgi:hypothetical protein
MDACRMTRALQVVSRRIDAAYDENGTTITGYVNELLQVRRAGGAQSNPES